MKVNKIINLIEYLEGKGWLDQLNIFFKNKYGVRFDAILRNITVEAYDFWSDGVGGNLPEGRYFPKEDRVLLQDTGLCGTSIDLGLIIHEFSHVAQYKTGLNRSMKRSVFSTIWNCNCFRSRKHKHDFYWNLPIEVDARNSVKEFEDKFGYSDLSGK